MSSINKIAIVANWDWVIYNFRLPLVQSLSNEGLRVVLVCPPGKYYEEMEGMGLELVPWSLRRRSTNPVTEIKSFFALLKIYRGHNFSAVHHFTIKPILYGSIAARIAKLPITINNFTGLGYLFSSSLRARILQKLVLPLYRIALNVPGSHTIFQNESVMAELLRLKLIDQANSTVIGGTGVDPAKYTSKRKLQPDSKISVFMASRLLYDKGVAEFVEAAKIIGENKIDVEFQLAGSPDSGNPASIPKTQIEQWKKLGIVQFLGHRRDIPELLKKTDIAVLPSHHEGIPLFLLEAAASSLPIVATDIEGAKLIVEHGENGLLVPVGNPEELAAAILKLVHDPKLRIKMGEANRRLVMERFDVKSINSRYSQLYRKLSILST